MSKFNIEVQTIDRYNLNNLYQKTPKGQGARTPINILNGISFGAYHVGHIRTKDQWAVLLYLHSEKTNVIYIKTRENEEIFINFKDSVKSYDFSSNMKQIYIHGYPSKC